jgi:hypothetical protein
MGRIVIDSKLVAAVQSPTASRGSGRATLVKRPLVVDQSLYWNCKKGKH